MGWIRRLCSHRRSGVGDWLVRGVWADHVNVLLPELQDGQGGGVCVCGTRWCLSLRGFQGGMLVGCCM